MPFNIQGFRSALRFDGARADLFEIRFQWPVGLQSGTTNEQFTFFCKASSIPADTISSIPVSYFGRDIKVSGNREFADWRVSIINDEDFLTRDLFELWMTKMNSHIGNLRDPSMLSPIDYQADAYVIQYGKTGDVLKEYRMVGAFPVEVEAIDLSWDNKNAIEEYGVTFSYQWWEARTTDDLDGQVPNSPLVGGGFKPNLRAGATILTPTGLTGGGSTGATG